MNEYKSIEKNKHKNTINTKCKNISSLLKNTNKNFKLNAKNNEYINKLSKFDKRYLDLLIQFELNNIEEITNKLNNLYNEAKQKIQESIITKINSNK